MKKVLYLLPALGLIGISAANIYACPLELQIPCITTDPVVTVIVFGPTNDPDTVPNCEQAWYDIINQQNLLSLIKFWPLSQMPADIWTFYFNDPNYILPINYEIDNVNSSEDEIPDLILQFNRAAFNNNTQLGAMYIPSIPLHGEAQITFCPTTPGCTLTPGYWKTHSKYGPSGYDDAWALIGEDTPFFSSGKSYYQVLWTNPFGGNAYYILAHAYIAAELNQKNGTSIPDEVFKAFEEAKSLFAANTPDNVAKKKGIAGNLLRARFIFLAAILDSYNVGILGPGHCRC